MTDAEIDRLAALADAATKGPWVVDGIARTIHVGPTSDPGKLAHDEAFVAAAREGVPALVAEIKDLRAENKELRDLIDLYRGDDWSR